MSVYAGLTPAPCLSPFVRSLVFQSPSVSRHVLTHGDFFLRRGTRSEVTLRHSARQPHPQGSVISLGRRHSSPLSLGTADPKRPLSPLYR